jgi:hypothetical protein
MKRGVSMRKFSGLLVTVLVLLPLVAAGTVVIRLTFEEQVKAATAIVRGKVGQSQAQWDEGHRRIWTYTELTVAESLKGSAKGTILVRQPGGVVGPIGQDVAGVATFSAGEEVVLFLHAPPDDASVWGVDGLAAGKVSLVRRLGTRMAVRDVTGLSFYERGERPRVELVGAEEQLGVAELFLNRLRKAAQ